MVICYYSEINKQWSESELEEKLKLLPEPLQIEAKRKKHWTDQQLSITGKLLLKELIVGLKASQLSLADIKYTDYNRPGLDSSIDFNIAHSGSFVICCGTDTGSIGVDIELIKPIELDDYIDYFTSAEWRFIRDSENQSDRFFECWTRKEAVVKALGTGLHTPLSTFDILNDRVIYNDISYYIQKLIIARDYQCHLASTEPVAIVDYKQIQF